MYEHKNQHEQAALEALDKKNGGISDKYTFSNTLNRYQDNRNS